MNKSEKQLAMIVGAFVALGVIYFLGSSASSAIKTRKDAISQLELQLNAQNQKIDAASRATRKLKALQPRSLPKDHEMATSLYSEWLLEQVDELGFRKPNVTVASRAGRSSYYQSSRYDIEAEATTPQLVKFLARFYQSGDLHRIDRLMTQPMKDSRHLDISMTIEAISLPSSTRTTVGDASNPELEDEQLASASDAIRSRNLFFPANIPPRLRSIRNVELTKGKRWSINAEGSDPDPWDDLSYSLVGEAPEGLRLRQRSRDEAELSWTPTELGEQTVTLRVEDTGSPPKQSEVSFRLTVVDPPPPEPEEDEGSRRRVLGFDHATQTFLMATVASKEKPQAWFNIRTQDRILKLSIGDIIQVGSIEGKLVKIARRAVEIETEEGTMLIRLMSALRPPEFD